MNTRTEIHCGCGASLAIEDSPGNLSWVTAQIEAFWVDHTHRCQDPEDDIEAGDSRFDRQTGEYIGEVVQPGGAPTTTPQSPRDE